MLLAARAPALLPFALLSLTFGTPTLLLGALLALSFGTLPLLLGALLALSFGTLPLLLGALLALTLGTLSLLLGALLALTLGTLSLLLGALLALSLGALSLLLGASFGALAGEALPLQLALPHVLCAPPHLLGAPSFPFALAAAGFCGFDEEQFETGGVNGTRRAIGPAAIQKCRGSGCPRGQQAEPEQTAARQAQKTRAH